MMDAKIAKALEMVEHQIRETDEKIELLKGVRTGLCEARSILRSDSVNAEVG